MYPSEIFPSSIQPPGLGADGAQFSTSVPNASVASLPQGGRSRVPGNIGGDALVKQRGAWSGDVQTFSSASQASTTELTEQQLLDLVNELQRDGKLTDVRYADEDDMHVDTAPCLVAAVHGNAKMRHISPAEVELALKSRFGDTCPGPVQATQLIQEVFGWSAHTTFIAATLRRNYEGATTVRPLSEKTLLWMGRVADIVTKNRASGISALELRRQLVENHGELPRNFNMTRVLNGLLARDRVNADPARRLISLAGLHELDASAQVSPVAYRTRNLELIEAAILAFETTRPYAPGIDRPDGTKVGFAVRPLVNQLRSLMPAQGSEVKEDSVAKVIGAWYGIRQMVEHPKTRGVVAEVQRRPAGSDNDRLVISTVKERGDTATSLHGCYRAQGGQNSFATFVKLLKGLEGIEKTGAFYHAAGSKPPNDVASPHASDGRKLWDIARDAAVGGIVSGKMAVHHAGDARLEKVWASMRYARSEFLESLPKEHADVQAMLSSAEYQARYAGLDQGHTMKFFRILPESTSPYADKQAVLTELRSWLENLTADTLVTRKTLLQKFRSGQMDMSMTKMIAEGLVRKAPGGWTTTARPVQPVQQRGEAPRPVMAPAPAQPDAVSVNAVLPHIRALDGIAGAVVSDLPWSALPEEVRLWVYGNDETDYLQELTMAHTDNGPLDRCLARSGLGVVRNDGGGAADCWLISLAQHASGDYTSAHPEMVARWRAQLVQEGLATPGQGMTAVGATARRAVQLVNDDLVQKGHTPLDVYSVNFTQGFAGIDHLFPDGRQDRNLLQPDPAAQLAGGARPVLIFDRTGHFEAIARR